MQDETSQMNAILCGFSAGMIDRRQAVAALHVRDYSELLMLLGQAGLPRPSLSAHEVEQQAETFARVWSSA